MHFFLIQVCVLELVLDYGSGTCTCTCTCTMLYLTHLCKLIIIGLIIMMMINIYCMFKYSENKQVMIWLKLSVLSARSRRSSLSEFQAARPATANARRPYDVKIYHKPKQHTFKLRRIHARQMLTSFITAHNLVCILGRQGIWTPWPATFTKHSSGRPSVPTRQVTTNNRPLINWWKMRKKKVNSYQRPENDS